jgi:hypothetical protein
MLRLSFEWWQARQKGERGLGARASTCAQSMVQEIDRRPDACRHPVCRTRAETRSCQPLSQPAHPLLLILLVLILLVVILRTGGRRDIQCCPVRGARTNKRALPSGPVGWVVHDDVSDLFLQKQKYQIRIKLQSFKILSFCFAERVRGNAAPCKTFSSGGSLRPLRGDFSSIIPLKEKFNVTFSVNLSLRKNRRLGHSNEGL